MILFSELITRLWQVFHDHAFLTLWQVVSNSGRCKIPITRHFDMNGKKSSVQACVLY